VAIIGAGVVGTALGVALSRCGYTISGVADIRAGAAQKAADRMGGVAHSTDGVKISMGANLILITTPDDAIAQTCGAIAAGGGFGVGDLVLHCSGGLSSEVLASAKKIGAAVASMHPIGVFADVETAGAQLSNLTYGLEGDAKALEEAEAIVRALGGRPIRVPKDRKVLIHIAACLTANYAVTLVDTAARLLRHLRMEREEAVRVLLPLFEGAISALQGEGLPQALTGPIARGDVATVERHVKAIRSDKELTRIYALLGLRTVPVAVEKGGLDKKSAQRLRDILKGCLEAGLSA
ncbi:MAG: Rossmann-like and DUF2520 domain-containing protein, partial [bacterium]